MEPFVRGFAQAFRGLCLLGAKEPRVSRQAVVRRQANRLGSPLADQTAALAARPRVVEIGRRNA